MAGFDDLPFDDAPTAQETFNQPASDDDTSSGFFNFLRSITPRGLRDGETNILVPAGPTAMPLLFTEEDIYEATDPVLDSAQGLLGAPIDIALAIPQFALLLADFGANRISDAVGSEFESSMYEFTEEKKRAAKDFVGLQPNLPAGEATLAATTLLAGLVGSLRYIGQATEAAKKAKAISDAQKQIAALEGVNPQAAAAAAKSLDDVLTRVPSRGDHFLTRPYIDRLPKLSSLTDMTSVANIIIPAERLGASRVGQAMLAGNGISGTLKQGVATSMAVGLADMTLANSSMTTLADNFEVLPDFTETYSRQEWAARDPGLFGKDEASRVLRNRLSFAGEGLALGFAFDAGLAGVQGASYIGGAIAGPIINTAGKVATTADSATGNVVSSAYNKLFDTYPALVMKKYFTTRGLQGPKTFEGFEDLKSSVKAERQNVLNQLELYTQSLEKAKDAMSPMGAGRVHNQSAYEHLVDYLEGRITLSDMAKMGFPKDALTAASRVKESRDVYSQVIRENIDREFREGVIDIEQYTELARAFDDLDGKYLRRVFMGGIADADMKALRNLPDFDRAVDGVMESMRRMGGEYDMFDDASLRLQAENFVEKQVSLSRFDQASEFEGMKKLSRRLRDDLTGASAERNPIMNINEDLLLSRNPILDENPLLRVMMGEVGSTERPFISPEAAALIQTPKLTDKEASTIRVISTIEDMSRLAETNRLYRSWLDDAEITVKASDFTAQERPLIVKDVLEEAQNRSARSGLPVGDEYENLRILLEREGYIEIPSSSNTVYGGRYGSLGGTYMRPEFFEAITVAQPSTGARIYGWFSAAKGFAQTMKTVPSPATQARNLTSVPGFLLANGNLIRSASFSDAIDIAWGKVLNLSDDEFNDFINYVNRVGVSDSGVMLQESRSLLAKARKDTRPENMTEEMRRNGFSWRRWLNPENVDNLPKSVKNLSGKPREAWEGLVELYKFSDNLARVANLVGERGNWSRALQTPMRKVLGEQNPRAEDYDLIIPELYRQGLIPRIGSPMADESLPFSSAFDYMVADFTKMEIPTYARTPVATKVAAGFPLTGNFVSFISENYRNAYNITRNGILQLNFAKSPELVDAMATLAARRAGQRQGLGGPELDEFVTTSKQTDEMQGYGDQMAAEYVRQINAMGVRRLGGVVASLGLLSAQTKRGIESSAGISERESQALITLGPPYLAGAEIAVLDNDPEYIDYINLSANFPYDGATSAARAGLRRFAKNQELNVPEGMTQIEAFATMFSKAIGDFGEESILAQHFLDITVRNGQIARSGGGGGRVWPNVENYPLQKKIEASARHMLGAVNPQIVNEFLQIHGRGFEPGKVTRAFLELQSGSGVVNEPVIEFMRLITGAGANRVNKDMLTYYTGSQYQRASTGSKSALATIINPETLRPSSTPESLAEKFLEAQEIAFRTQQNFRRELLALQDLGISEDRIKEIFKVRKIVQDKKELENLFRGVYTPLTINKSRVKTLEAAREAQMPVPEELDSFIESMSDLNLWATETFIDVSLDEDYPLRSVDVDEAVEEEFFPDLSSAAPAQINTAPQLPSAPIPSTVTPVAAAQQPVNPSLLGDNPIEQARNLELANRLRGRS